MNLPKSIPTFEELRKIAVNGRDLLKFATLVGSEPGASNELIETVIGQSEDAGASVADAFSVMARGYYCHGYDAGYRAARATEADERG